METPGGDVAVIDMTRGAPSPFTSAGVDTSGVGCLPDNLDRALVVPFEMRGRLSSSLSVELDWTVTPLLNGLPIDTVAVFSEGTQCYRSDVVSGKMQLKVGSSVRARMWFILENAISPNFPSGNVTQLAASTVKLNVSLNTGNTTLRSVSGGVLIRCDDISGLFPTFEVPMADGPLAGGCSHADTSMTTTTESTTTTSTTSTTTTSTTSTTTTTTMPPTTTSLEERERALIKALFADSAKFVDGLWANASGADVVTLYREFVTYSRQHSHPDYVVLCPPPDEEVAKAGKVDADGTRHEPFKDAVDLSTLQPLPGWEFTFGTSPEVHRPRGDTFQISMVQKFGDGTSYSARVIHVAVLNDTAYWFSC